MGKITASRQAGGHSSVESWYYLPELSILAGVIQPDRTGLWGIENQLHWVLDMVFYEHQFRKRKDNCPDNLALLRKLALDLVRLEPSKGSMRGELKRAGWDNSYLATLLSNSPKSKCNRPGSVRRVL